MKIIAIHDGKGGHKSQLMGVINGFVGEDIEIIQSHQSILKFLPNFLVEQLLFILNKYLYNVAQPNLIISIGKSSLPYAIYFKKKYPKSKLVFLMPSGNLSKKYGDLIFYHSYKDVNYNNKYIPIPSAPHLINNEALLTSYKDWENEFSNFKKPIISVVLGGDAKKIKLTHQGIDDLVSEIKKLKSLVGGSIFVSTSRRTGYDNERYLKTQIQKIISDGDCFFWGYYENQNNKKNPYLAMLSISKYVVISGESISMISEACSLPKEVGVYIFFSKHFSSNRYIKFHEDIYKNNHAKNLIDFTTKKWERSPLNSTNFIVEEIKNIIK